MTKVVVTGGAGFIGSHLAAELASQGYYVTVLDNLLTGRRENIEDLLKQKNVEFVQGNITDLPLLQKLFQNVTYVFHHAAIIQIPFSLKDPLTTNEINIGGTLKVLLAARDNKVKKVIFASSSSVYGNTAKVPQKEDMPTNPLSPYALTKLTGEYYCQIFRQEYGLATVCLRYFNIYGPGQDSRSRYTAVIPTFIDQISQNQPPVIFGDGNQSRDFVFVKDVVQANILAAETKAEGSYNIGSGRSVTINELAQTILQLMQRDLSPIHDQPNSAELRHSLADISQARSFGYQPKWTLKEGLTETINYFTKEKAKVATKKESS